ncbi:hypothetical protein, partial [Actinopolymorpha pittospori]
MSKSRGIRMLVAALGLLPLLAACGQSAPSDASAGDARAGAAPGDTAPGDTATPSVEATTDSAGLLSVPGDVSPETRNAYLMENA